MATIPLSKKQVIEIDMTPASGNKGMRERVIEALNMPEDTIKLTSEVIQRLYAVCIKGNDQLTATMVMCLDHWKIIKIEENDTTEKHYGLAVDLGSTSIAMSLIDMNSQKVVETIAQANGQIKYGDDILTRIFYVKDNANRLQEVQRTTVNTLEDMIRKLQSQHGFEMKDIAVMMIAGNTTMSHFLAGVDPWPLFSKPYIPVFCNHEMVDARTWGFSEGFYLYLTPCVANYLGGDAMSGIIYSGLPDQDELGLFIDIGTNGEMIIGNKTFLIAAAGAAGPALESGVSTHGMRAEEGAVDTLRIVGHEFEITTIGNVAPIGICGSGIVDLLAEMLVHGWIDMSGHFNPDQSKAIIKTEEGYGVGYAVTDAGEPLIFTEKDIQAFMDTKAAASTMVEYLLEASGMKIENVDTLHLAGGFGTHMNIENAIAVGIYPDVPRDRLHMLGNASLKGAQKMLLDSNALINAQNLLNKIYYLELGEAKNFLTKMYASKFLPHTDLKRYPTVMERIKRTSGKES